jgi:WD40 repeat protein
VARLRRALGRDAVQTTGSGYRLTLTDDEIDVRRFEALVARARALTGAGEHDRAAAVLGQALGLWRGTALPDLDRWPDGRTEAGRLDELRLGAQEALLAERAAAGRDVVADASALVAAQPLRETRWHLLALALYRSGRQSDALAALRQARRTLQEELGLDPGQQLVDLERAILNHDADLVVPTATAGRDLGVCPYQGLVVYDRGDADRFFGRGDEVAACVRVLRDSSLLVVAGPSGSGKSSLVRAGVVPRLERAGRHVVVISPGTDPRGALAGAEAAPGRDLVLVVDQLEELFTGSHDPEVVVAFLDRVAALVGSGRAAVLVVRADQVGGFSRSPAVARLVERGLHLVTSMTERDLRSAIEGPARQAGLRLEPGLVELLVRDTEGEPGALPLLSHALVETWERREGAVLTVDGYGATGGIRGAVAQSAERMWESLPPQDRAAVRALLLRLVTLTPDGEPAAARLPLSSVTDDPDRKRLVDLLVRCRLATTDESSVTVAHEAVVRAWPRLRSWLDEDAAGQRRLRHLAVAAEDWQTTGQPASELYRGERLHTALEWRRLSAPALTSTENAYLDASATGERAEQEAVQSRAEQRTRAHRRLRLALTGTAAGLVLALVGGLVAVQQSHHAGQTARAALVDRLVAQSAALRATRRDLAALLAVEAFRLDPSAETRGGMLGVLTGTPGFLGYRRIDAPMVAGRLLPGGGNLLATSSDGTVRLVDTRTGRTTRTLPRPAQATFGSRVSLSADGRTLAVIWLEGEDLDNLNGPVLSVYDVASGTRRVPDTHLPLHLAAVAVGPDGRYVAVSGLDGGRALVYDTAGVTRLPELLNVDEPKVGVVSLPSVGLAPPPFLGYQATAGLAFQRDGTLVLGSEVGVVRLVDPASGTVRRRLSGAGPLTSNETVVTTADPTTLVTAGSRGLVRWDLRTGKPAWSVPNTIDGCRGVTVSTRTGAVLCGGASGRVVARDLATGRETGTSYDMQRGGVSELLISSDGRTLVQLSRAEAVLSRWRLDGTGPLTRVLPVRGSPEAYNADGTLLLVGEAPDTIVVDARTGDLVSRLGADELAPIWTERPFEVLAWTADGAGFAVDVRDHRQTMRLDSGLGDPPDAAVLSADGRHLLAWSADVGEFASKAVWVVWELRTGLIEGEQQTAGIGTGSLSRHGRTVVWVGDGRAESFDTATGRRTAGHGQILHAAFSGSGLLATATEGGQLVLYRHRHYQDDRAVVGSRTGRVREMTFARHRDLLVVNSGEDGVRLVDTAAGVQLGEPFDLGPAFAADVAVRPDGRALALPHPDGVLVWDLRPSAVHRETCRLAGRTLSADELATYLPAVQGAGKGCPT